ncbi:MAG: hypothetical protein Q8O67_00080 [Deltaproteobacteria bacterium]|nr:hypothetical protein [Deltaproteobacteria bacterium]
MRQRVHFPNLEEAERRIQYIYETLARINGYLKKNVAVDGPSLDYTFSRPGEPFRPWQDFLDAFHDDFNTPKAIAALNDLLRVANLLVAGREKEATSQKLKPPLRARLLTEGRDLLANMGALLGFGEQEPTAFLEMQRALRLKVRGIEVARVEALMNERAAAKTQKDFTRADAVRASLVELGIEVRDTADGVEWSVL